MQWSSDSIHDMYADAVLAVVLKLESSPEHALTINGKTLQLMSAPVLHVGSGLVGPVP